MFQIPDLAQPLYFLGAIFVFFLILTVRYFLVAGIFWCFFYVWFREKWRTRTLHDKTYSSAQLKTEIRWSILTGLIFSVAGAVTLLLWQKGYTRVYTDLNLYGWWFLPVSLLLSLLIHETYYYWVHRWMHRPAVFKIVHKVHHESRITSPWTAFSFHPLEGLLQALIFPAILLVVPLHIYMVFLQLVLMSISSVINHLEIELLPKRFYKSIPGRWLIGATHHSMHHKQFRYNYGLYFTFLDKLHKTESPKYGKDVEELEKH